MKEENVLAHVAETLGVGLPDLARDKFNAEFKAGIYLEVAGATWSVPFDCEEDVPFMATAY